MLIAIPIFVIGFVFQLVFGVKLGWGAVTVGGEWTISKLILPAIVLGAVDFAYTLRLTRTSVAENLAADHVRTARAKGLSHEAGGAQPRAAQLAHPGHDPPRREPG